MRNVFRVFKNDMKVLSKHFFALTIVISIAFLPALYAWFNIYAFWDPYGKINQVEVAVVCNDQDYMDEEGRIILVAHVKYRQQMMLGNEYLLQWCLFADRAQARRSLERIG